MEENLTQVGSFLGNLKIMALDMGNDTEAQNRQVQRITEKADTSEDCIDIANARAKKLINSESTAALLYHSVTCPALPSESLPFQSLKFWFHTLLIKR